MRRITVVVPLLIVLAGCGAGGGSKASSADSAGSGSFNGAKSAPAARPALAKDAQVQVPRSLIRTAALAVRVKDVKAASAAVASIVSDVGGEVVDEQLDLSSGEPHASLTLHVPPQRLGSTLDRVAGLGHEQSRRLGTEDVTDKVVDLDSRLATQRTSVTRVRALLDRASSLSDVVRIESELSRREADLESLQARVRAVSGQVAMSDVTVELTTGGRAEPASAIGFLDGLHGGWHALVVTARVSGAALGALLPFLPLLVAAGWLALWWRRRVSTP